MSGDGCGATFVDQNGGSLDAVWQRILERKWISWQIGVSLNEGDNPLAVVAVGLEDVEGDNEVFRSQPSPVDLHRNIRPTAIVRWERQAPGRHARFRFDAVASSAGELGDAFTQYAWRFGDGRQDVGLQDVVEHRYDESGEYRVRLMVTDRCGATSIAVAVVRAWASGDPDAPECIDDDDCVGTPLGTCFVGEEVSAASQCEECREDEDCADHPGGPFCSFRRQCTACTSDPDCPQAWEHNQFVDQFCDTTGLEATWECVPAPGRCRSRFDCPREDCDIPACDKDSDQGVGECVRSCWAVGCPNGEVCDERTGHCQPSECGLRFLQACPLGIIVSGWEFHPGVEHFGCCTPGVPAEDCSPAYLARLPPCADHGDCSNPDGDPFGAECDVPDGDQVGRCVLLNPLGECRDDSQCLGRDGHDWGLRCHQEEHRCYREFCVIELRDDDGNLLSQSIEFNEVCHDGVCLPEEATCPAPDRDHVFLDLCEFDHEVCDGEEGLCVQAPCGEPVEGQCLYDLCPPGCYAPRPLSLGGAIFAGATCAQCDLGSPCPDPAYACDDGLCMVRCPPDEVGAACDTGEPGSCAAGEIQCEAGEDPRCEPQVEATHADICDNGVDDDCDGDVDEAVCGCEPGAREVCGSDVGVCELGERVCSGQGFWGGCQGAVEPSPEQCDHLDHDCDGEWVTMRKTVAELPPGATRRVPLTATFSARGEHHLGTLDVGALVPGGIAVGPRRQTTDCRFLVLPRVAPVRSLALPLSQRYQPGGVALASKTGESMDILGVRPYRPGDPVRDLHARTWARAGEPMVRQYQQEYFSRVGVVLDTDAGVSTESQREAAISLAAGVAAALTRSEALIDLLVVGDRVHPLTLGRSLGHLEQALDLLSVVRPGPTLDGGALTRRLAPYLSRLSAVVLIALAWDEPRQTLEASIRLAGTGCRTLLVAPPSAARAPLPEAGVALSAREINSAEALVL